MMNIKHMIIVFMVGYVGTTYSAITEKNKVYLENHYGAPIICKVLNNNTKEDDRLRSNKDVVVNNQNRVLLGLIPHAKNSASRLQWVNDINIKTTSSFSQGYTSLTRYLDVMGNAINQCCMGNESNWIESKPLCADKKPDMERIKKLPGAQQFCCVNKICKKDAVIVIYPSYIGWNIDVQWRDPSRTVIGQ